MRIAMLTNNYKPFVGGVPISIERLSNGLRKLGHEVYIFAPSYEDEVEEPYVIRYRSRKKKLKGEITIPDFLDQSIEEKFAAYPFDLIHVHHPMLMGYTAQYLGRKYNTPVVFTYHTRYEQYLHYLKPYDLLQKHFNRHEKSRTRAWERKLLYGGSEKLVKTHNRIFTNRCSLVFAPTESMKQYLEEQGTTTNVEVVPTGLLEEDFQYEAEKVKKIRNHYIDGKKYLFCTVSRLEKEKNIDFLLKGLAKLKENKGDCFRLLLIGAGSEREELGKEVIRLGLEKNVTFCGGVEHSEIRNYYRACDLFLFASKSETQGIVLLEAMAAGLPVIAVDATGTRDVVYDGFNGYLSELDIDSWERNLESLLENAHIRKWMKQNAISEAKSYLSHNVARKVQYLYERVLLYHKSKGTASYVVASCKESPNSTWIQ
ncbi:MAG: glycosyltransferase family 4 protein [Clostridiales bacterium]|nr:glycosyltransferase family 4 protein [Clostridiales bacterium]